MAFCPNCEAEYVAGITACPDCNIELVPELTPETRVHDTSDAETVPFRSFSNSAEAEVVFEMLQQNGIRAYVKGAEFVVLPTNFSQEVVVMVDERDLTRAMEIYEAYFDAESTDSAGEQAGNE